jgi:hypothetical protein
MNVDSDNHCELVDIGKRGLDGNAVLGREEASSTLTPEHPWDFFL